MLALHWEFVDYQLKKILGILQTLILAPLFFTRVFGQYVSKEGKYSRHFMLAIVLFIAFNSEDYYLSTKDK